MLVYRQHKEKKDGQKKSDLPLLPVLLLMQGHHYLKALGGTKYVQLLTTSSTCMRSCTVLVCAWYLYYI